MRAAVVILGFCLLLRPRFRYGNRIGGLVSDRTARAGAAMSNGERSAALHGAHGVEIWGHIMSSLLVRVLAVLVGMVLVTFSAGSEVRAGDDGGRPRVSADGVLVGEAGSGQLTRLPPAAGVTRHYPDGSTERVDVSAGF